MKDEFLATLSHEVRTPLNAILGWAQVMKMPGTGVEEFKQGLDVIERNARAQAQLIDDLLDMSRIINGKFVLDVKPVCLEHVVQAAIDTLAPAAHAKRIRLRVQFNADNALIDGDGNRLQQVFWNLLSNAIKFTPPEGDISVTVQRDATSFTVSMADSGEGIEQRFLPQVFDRFRQADASTTRRHGGLGIGLSIVKQLVESHGGKIQVASPGLGHGTTFVVTLPLLQAGDAASATVDQPNVGHPAEASPFSPLTVASLKGLQILVVDDEDDARGMMRLLLEAAEAKVTACGSAADAFAALRVAPFDLLVSDIGMPVEDGYSLIRRVRTLPATENGRICAVALTAYARTSDRDKVIAAGFDAHVAKPVESQLLIRTLAELKRPG